MKRKRSVQIQEEHFDLLRNIFGCKYEEKTSNSVKTRLERDYYVSNMLKILFALAKNRMQYRELYATTRIRSEDAFLQYVKWMTRINLVAKDSSTYTITNRGTKIVDAFS